MLLDRLLSPLIAHGLADSPRAAELCAALSGRRLAIRISGTPTLLRIESTGAHLHVELHNLTAPDAPPADATLIGPPLSLLRLAREQDLDRMPSPQVRVEGDSHVAQQFRELALLLRPDVETALARVLGPGSAHLMVRGARSGGDLLRQASRASMRNLADYLAHERADLVSRPEGEAFLRGVEQLREQLDRLEARLHALEQRTRQLPGAAD